VHSLIHLGTGKDENLFTNPTEFFDRKEFACSSGGGGKVQPGSQLETHV